VLTPTVSLCYFGKLDPGNASDLVAELVEALIASLAYHYVINVRRESRQDLVAQIAPGNKSVVIAYIIWIHLFTFNMQICRYVYAHCCPFSPSARRPGRSACAMATPISSAELLPPDLLDQHNPCTTP
jgi:hypothetical protein